MPKSENLDDQLDAALDDILSEGWEEPAAPQVEAPEPAPLPPELAKYPPVPVREEQEPHGGALLRREAAAEPVDEDARGMFDIGLLADLAAGRKNAVEAARAAGVTEADLHSQLATALREVDPKEISKAMGLQAAEQQLKSGALYGAVIADLVSDLVAGRLKADQKIELAKMLARVGRIEPKEDKNAGVGGGFQLVINLAGAQPPQPVTIEAE